MATTRPSPFSAHNPALVSSRARTTAVAAALGVCMHLAACSDAMPPPPPVGTAPAVAAIKNTTASDAVTPAPATASATTNAKPEPVTLVAGQQMAHAKVRGSVGPWPAAEVWLTQSSEVDDAPFKGMVYVPETEAPTAAYALPAPDEPESVFVMKVLAVMFRNVDETPERELIVLYRATRIGPQQPTTYASCVYQWDGTAFKRLPTVEARLSGAKNGAEIDSRLAKKAMGSKP